MLSKQLLASILICLALTVLTGMYLMKKSLAPLRIINDTLETIEVNQLDNRITLSDNRNELHDLAVTINQALDRIEYGYKQQQQFISDASHELRTPITVIAGYADLLDRWGKMTRPYCRKVLRLSSRKRNTCGSLSNGFCSSPARTAAR